MVSSMVRAPTWTIGTERTSSRGSLHCPSRPAATTVADGSHWRLSPQGYFYTGPFGVLAEYVFSSQRVRRDIESVRLGTTAWQVATSYVLTGEDSSYRGVTPRSAFDPSDRAWGAIELTARVNELTLDEGAFPFF